MKARLVKLRAVGATLSKLPSDEAAHLRVALRKSRRQKTTINVLSKENARLRRAVKGSRTRREASDALLAKLRATGKSLSKSLRGADAELRRALRRSRRQKATIRSLSRENARLRKRAKASLEPDRDAGSAACEASLDRGSAVEGAVRPQEREAGDAALRASARPAARRPRRRGCSPEHSTGPASGRASCSNTAPASAPCTGLPRGCPARGCRSRRGRWPTA